jgi:hypothetical protein
VQLLYPHRRSFVRLIPANRDPSRKGNATMHVSKYTTDQLLAYLRHLDRVIFAANVTAIEQELIRRGVTIPAWVYA